MAVAKKVKLYKIASEINIGKDTIVDYLQSKGYDIQNKPTATLNDDMVNLIHEKFKRELRAAEMQREKILKHKVVKKPKETDSYEVVSDTPVAKPEETSKVDPVQSKEETKPKAEAEKVETKVQEDSEKVEGILPGIKVGDVISLDSKKDSRKTKQTSKPAEPKRTEVKHEPQVAKEKQVEPKVTPKAPKEEVKTTEPKIEVKAEPKGTTETKPATPEAIESEESKVVETPKAETPDVEVPKVDAPKEEAKVEAPKVEAKPAPEKEKAEEKAETPKVETPKAESKVAEEPAKEQEIAKVEAAKEEVSKEVKAEPERDAKKKKTQTILEVQPDEPNKLRGLTVIGKIDISKEKSKAKAKKRRPRKEAEEETTDEVIETKKGYKKPKPRIGDKRAEVLDDDKAKPKKKEPPKVQPVVKAQENKKRKRKKSIREQISDKDVEKAIRQTISGIDDSSALSQRQKIRQKKKLVREEKEQKQQEEKLLEDKILKLTEFVTTADLAKHIGLTPNDIIMKCIELGMMVTINQRLDKDSITVIADDYGFEVEFLDEQEIHLVEDPEDPEDTLLPRPPIVTIMGHVDHGKTSLLDFIRNSNVVAGEAGGITQHIGAYQVKIGTDRFISFLDTPGHEAFTAMRARGAQVTDIVILVVAADDSVMPQTIEAISHAQAASVPIVVAINKIDKPDANPDRIKQQLADHNVLVEDWGGKYQSVEISAKKGLNIDNLLEKILLEAEILELKANPDRNARGIVIETNMAKGVGPTATVMIQKGTLKVGDTFVAGVFSGRVRAMHDEHGNIIKEAGPSKPVLVMGFDGLAEAGDTFIVTKTETEARNIATDRKQLKREQEMRRVRHFTLDQISKQISEGGIKDLNLVIKGDVAGSVEALSDSLLKLSNEEVRVNILHKGVGPISETDVMLASASGAVIIGFNVSPNVGARKVAEAESVDIRNYNIIYDCINEIQLALEGLLSPDIKEELLSEVEVRQTFKISKIGTIAGCYVLTGKINRNDKIRVIRDGLKVFEGYIESLKRGKDDVKEADAKFECGIQIQNFNDIKEGDIIESFKLVEVKRTLS